MRTYLVITGILFGVVALMHLWRLAAGWPIQIAALSVPLWVSVIGLLVPGGLCIWAFALARGGRGA
jgi:hypothetical protein